MYRKFCLKNLLVIAVTAMLSIGFISCKDDNSSSNNTLKGWYTSLNDVAKASDFDKINDAIRNGEVLSSYRYDGQTHTYIASRSLFIDNDGRYNDSNSYFGRLRFSVKDLINAIRIVDNSTLIFYIATLYEDGAVKWADAVYKFYAGPIFGNMTYYGQAVYYTYVRAENKIVVSNGDIYTIVDGGLVKDGSSRLWSKYDPSKTY